MNWEYKQPTGDITDPHGVFVHQGYAGGNCGQHPEGINNHEMQNVHNIGPLPVGFYTMAEVVEGSHLGPFAIRLEPDPANIMFGRGGFFVHGDTQIPFHASDGCIIMPRAVREQMWASDNHQIEVVA